MGKEKKTLSQDYLVCRLREKIASEQYTEKRLSLVGIGSLSRRLIPVPVATIILLITFLFLISTGQQVSESSLEDNILSGAPVTTEAALGLILGVQD